MVEGTDPRRRYVLEAVVAAKDNGYSFVGYRFEDMASELALAAGCPYTTAEIEAEIRALYKELMWK